MAIEVTVRDTETDESQTATVENDYVLVCAGSCYQHHVQASANGTHVITVKGRRNSPRTPEDPDDYHDRVVDEQLERSTNVR